MLSLMGLGLGLAPDFFYKFTYDSWGHMRVLRFPSNESETALGINSHTDYGLLVLASQDDVGGLWIRPPIEGEVRGRNWLEEESSAGFKNDTDEGWCFVEPVEDYLTMFPGDML